jgi:hypothetical protein
MKVLIMIDFTSFIAIDIVISLMLFVISILLPLIHILLLHQGERYLVNIQELMLKYALFFNIGCLFVVGFAGQILYSREIASCVAWQWSPFQYELAFSELALGVLGLSCTLFNHHFWLATIIGSCVWLLGAAGTQLYDKLLHGTTAVAGANFVISWNIFLSIWLIALYVLFYKSTKLKVSEWLCGEQSK